MCIRKTLRIFGVYGLFTFVVTGNVHATEYGFAKISLKDGTVQTVHLEVNGPKQTLTSFRNGLYIPDVRTTISGARNSISTLPRPECFNNCDRVELEAKGTSTGRVILRFNVEHRDVPRPLPPLNESEVSISRPETTGWTIEGAILIRDKQVVPLVLTLSGEQVGTLTWANESAERVN